VRPLRYFTLWRLLGWLAVTVVIALSLVSQPPVEVPLRYGDKWGHLLAYGVLMGWFVQLYQRRGTLLWHALFLIALGVALEFLQGYTGRYFEYADMAANTTGVVLGLSLALTRWQSLLLRWEQRLPRRDGAGQE
jgi:VanZ family protein